jgi:hypothetical protein
MKQAARSYWRVRRDKLIGNAIEDAMDFYHVTRFRDEEAHALVRREPERVFDEASAITDKVEMWMLHHKITKTLNELDHAQGPRMLPSRVIARAAYGITYVILDTQKFDPTPRAPSMAPCVMASLALLLTLSACKRDEVRQMNPLDLPPVLADEPPKEPWFDYQCYESLRRQEIECRRDCGRFNFAPSDGVPSGCYRDHVSVKEGNGQTLWEKCDSCEVVCAVPIYGGFAAKATGNRPPCPEGEHIMCGYIGPDPHVACKVPR